MTTSFIMTPDLAAVDQPPADEAVIRNDGFFPDIDPAQVREDGRISSMMSAPRLRAAIVAAIMTVAQDLKTFSADAVQAGHATLGDVPAPQLDGQSVQLIRYQRAVVLYAKAELVERYRDFDTTNQGGKQADDLSASIGELRRDALHAVRDMLGKSRTTIDLI